MAKLHFLTSLCFGVHSPRRCTYRALLSDHENKRFIIIIFREEPQQVDGRISKAVQHVVSRVWDKNNPFSWGDDSPAHRVVALEISWSSIVGIDYRCPLHDDGKLVLEARHVVKRCFKTVEDARDFYSPHTTRRMHTGSWRASYSTAATPSKISFDERHGLLSPLGSAHPGAALPVSPHLVRPIVGCRTTSSTGRGMRLVASADVCSAAEVISGGSLSAGRSDWLASLAGSASCGAAVVRSDMEPGPHRSISATRAPRSRRAAGATYRLGCAVGRLPGNNSGVSGSSCMDFASADEGAGSCRQRRGWAAASGGSAAVQDGRGITADMAARRRLQLRDAEARPGAGQAEASSAGAGAGPGVAAAPVRSAKMCTEGCTSLQKYDIQGESPRKARSATDLCGMMVAAAPVCLQGSYSEAPAAAAAASAAFLANNKSTEWCASASDAWACAAAAQRRSSVASAGGLEHARFVRSRTGGSAGSGVAIGHSSSVDSLRAAFLSEKKLANELHSWRRRHGGGRARRQHASWTQLPDAGFDGSGGGGGGEARGSSGQVPRASRWTQPSATFSSKTLVLGFRDPDLPQELRRFVKSDMRLLKLYESGLPAWAVFMPCYGLPYRPWLRRALWLLFIAISIFSMGCGFYDLYKNVPFLKQVITAVASRMYLPAAELFEWLERHTQIRMSILLTYMFSKSPLLMSLMRMLRSLAALLQQLLRPAAVALSTALQPMLAALQMAVASVGGGVVAAADAVWLAVRPLVTVATVSGREVIAFLVAVLGPPARALWAVAVLLAQLVRLVVALVGMVLMGPVQLACSIGGVLSWAGTEVAERLAVAAEAVGVALRWMLTMGRAAHRTAPAVKTGARLALQAAGGVAGGGGGGGLGGGMVVWHRLGLEVVDAYNAMRLTFLQAFKSAQAVVNFCITVAQAAVQHRVSLLLQLRRFITRQKERLPPAVAASVPLPAFVSRPSFGSLTPYDVPLPGPDHDPDLDEGPELLGSSATPPAEHSLYDPDMVVLGSSEDESHLLAQEPLSLYREESLPRDRGGLSEPIPGPFSGCGGGLRRRHHRGTTASRGSISGDPMRHCVYDVMRPRLDAVDEEDVEDPQQLSDSDSLGGEVRCAGDKAEGLGSHLSDDGVALAAPHLGVRDAHGSAWMSQRGFLGATEAAASCPQAEDGDYLRYASAPSCSISATAQGGGLLEEISFHAADGVGPSQPVPSRQRGQGLDQNPVAQSVSSATQARGVQSSVGHQTKSSRRQQQRQQQQQQQEQQQEKQKKLQQQRQQQQQQEQQQEKQKQQQQQQLNHPKQQQQRLPAAQCLGRSASSPPDASATNGAAGAGATAGDGRHRELRWRKREGAASCQDTGTVGSIEAAMLAAGAMASDPPRGEPLSVLSTGATPASSGGYGADALTCSSAFVRGNRSVHPSAVGGSVSSEPQAAESVPASVCTGRLGAVVGSDKDVLNKGQGSAGGGTKNACGKRPAVAAKHVSRQPAIQAA